LGAAGLVLVFAGPRHAQGPPEPQVAGGASPAVPPAPAGLNLSAAQNPLLGGVVAGKATPGVLPLTLGEAIARGLRQNLGAVIGEQAIRSASASRLSALNGLLPNAYARLGESREVVNLEAFGFPLPPGTDPLVGPFNVFDARINVSQSLFNWSAIQAARAGGDSLRAAKFSYQDARDAVVFVVSNLYLTAISSASEVDSAQAQVKTSQALYDRATDLKKAGMIPAIEVLRAQVQLQAQQQRLIFFQNEYAKRKLGLARAIGLPLDQQFDLADKVPYAALASPALEQALAQAYESRADLQAARAQVRAAEESKQAAIGSALPTLGLTADIGKIGLTTASKLRTYSIAAGIRIPIFEGNTVRARVLQADAALRQQQALLEDLRARIDYEVRTALLDLKAADDRVQVARTTVELANQQLVQAQDRFSAGVASNIEVVQAQEAVATASDNYIASLYAHNLAKISLARALGIAEADAGRLLGGTK